jgi:hypothetical protein
VRPGNVQRPRPRIQRRALEVEAAAVSLVFAVAAAVSPVGPAIHAGPGEI